MAKDKGQDKYNRRHKRNIKSYEKQVDDTYKSAIAEAVAIVGILGAIKPDGIFSFDDYPTIRKRADKMLFGLRSQIEAIVVNGINAEWTLANNKNSELANRVFGKNVGKLTQAQYRRYYSTNDSARKTFLKRKANGLNLSDRVWKYTDQFKEEIEMGLDVGIRNGVPANKMTRDLKQYLRHPDKLFRRVRDEHGQLQLSKAAKAYHPGRGVYRSSYKNARRLTATETNMAYRTADYERWQQLDFIVGIKIEPSVNNHETDICDDLAGKYPKDFKWTGWHPHCRCHALTILKTEKELDADTERILNGEEPTTESVNKVEAMPENFSKWVTKNQERIEKAKALPDWIKDNKKVEKVISKQTDEFSSITNSETKVKDISKSRALFDGYDKNIWTKESFFDENSGGYYVSHKDHNFEKEGEGGKAELIVGEMLARKGKRVEFLAEVHGKSNPDMMFDGVTWDVKFAQKANGETLRKYIKDASKADNAIFFFGEAEKEKIKELQTAINRQVGHYRKEGKLYKMPNVYIIGSDGKMRRLYKKTE